MRRLVKWILIGPIKLYQLAVSPFTPPCCRFYPSCSEYAVQAIDKHGALKGGWLAVKRVGKCHPLHSGGYDPVP
ncbi:MAG: membrane protein insertion efficiency factor YidD [Candidatus Bipolaricaulia bacterium]